MNMMNARVLYSALLLGMCLLFWGCPYESEVPVDEPNMAADKDLKGKWRHIAEEKSYAAISIHSDNVFKLVYNSWTTEHRSYDVKQFTAHLSVLSGKLFVNIKPEMKTGGSYYICEFSVNATKDTIRLKPISETQKKKFTNSVELRNWMMKKMKKKDFFEKEEVFVRVP